jgi:hypothetical protein
MIDRQFGSRESFNGYGVGLSNCVPPEDFWKFHGTMRVCGKCGQRFRTFRQPPAKFICGPCTPPDCEKPQSRVVT